MKKKFSTCLLIQDGPLAPGLLKTEVNLPPGVSFSSDQGKTVLLAGGFSSVSPESGFPLSPTLQLNYDLATFSDQELLAIARAELFRITAVNYRSYTVAADNQVAVIGNSVEQLQEFVNTYGGVLAIEPLLVKGYHRDFSTVLELNLDSRGKGCRLEYQVRSPLAAEKCIYCGACGPVCPVGCISENLFFDYSRCNYCKECEDVCESRAIDIHGVLHKVLEVPAVIVLDGVRVELPEGTDKVYYESTLPDYFATLFPSQIDEIITCDNNICQYSGRLGHGCDLCLSGCRCGAIAQSGEGVTVDAGKCEECGACAAICPTGALQNERFSDRVFVDYLKGVAIPQDGTAVIGGAEVLHQLWWLQQGKKREKTFFLQYDKAQSLSLFNYLYLFMRGVRRVIVLFNQEHGAEVQVAQKQMELANAILSRLHDVENAVIITTPDEFDLLWAMPPAGSFGQAIHLDTPFVNRRQTLALALESLVQRSGREVVLQPEGYTSFATVKCDSDRCTQCMACLNDCRIQALRADQQQLTLNHLGAMCVGCGICLRICPEDALSISSMFTLGPQFFIPVEFARAEPMACRNCGKVFGTRKSFDRVMAILAKKELVDISHFELCETCRVVKLFEVH